MPIKNFLGACARTLYQKSFYTAYHRTFEVKRVNSDELLDQVFRLRYDVYVKENGFIDPEIVKNGLERDIYDRHAGHALLIHRASGRAVGTVRVVLPRDDKPLYSFPLQSACDHPLLYMEDKIGNFCEISRLCMSNTFRRREGDGALLPAYYDGDWVSSPENNGEKLVYFRRMIPYAPLGLLMSAFEIAVDSGITNCLCVLDKDQLHVLKMIGLDYKVLGPQINFFGKQQPVVFNVKNALDNMLTVNAPCWDIVSDGGRIQSKANRMQQYDWHDAILGGECQDRIIEHVGKNPKEVLGPFVPEETQESLVDGTPLCRIEQE